MNILGISGLYHDSAAALICHGQIVAAAQEERFTRRKNDHSFPSEAIAYCLKAANLTIADIDSVAFYDLPWLKLERLLETYTSFAPGGYESFRHAIPKWWHEKLWIPKLIRSTLGYDGEIVFCQHHISHAASAFYPSPFPEAAIITADGVGEWASTSWGVGEANTLKLHKELRFPDSLGLLYSAFTMHLGFKVNCDEYKVMGLAPYGEPRFSSLIRDNLIAIRPDGSFKMNMDYFEYCTGTKMVGAKFEKLFETPTRAKNELLTQVHMDLARSLQDVIETAMLTMARHVRTESGKRNLCLAGGVALNCVANGKIQAANIFDELWIQPAAGDAGGAIGAALYVHHQLLGNARDADGTNDSQSSSLLGPEYSDERIERFLETNQYPYTKFETEAELVKHTATLIDNEDVVGWFQGRMEFGPRALGNRSIIGDARSPQIQSTLNLKIKNRESFRPFAPSVLEEYASDYFDTDARSPYMLIVAPVQESKRHTLTSEQEALFGIEKLKVPRSVVPAITHVDFSARLQTVTEQSNSRYYQLIEAVRQRTDCPMIVNTSFNVMNEPVVMTPRNAYECFATTKMDRLVLGSYVLDKQKQAKRMQLGTWIEGIDPEKHFTIAVLGGSTSLGEPYEGQAGFGRIAGFFFGGEINGREVRVLNLAQPGRGSRDVKLQAQRVPATVDAVFLYCGQNDQCMPSVHDSFGERTLVDQPGLSEEEKSKRLAEYEGNLRAIVAHVEGLGVPLIMSTVASNIAEHRPFRSAIKNSKNKQTILGLYEDARRHADAGSPRQAIDSLESLLEIEGEFAMAHFLAGECYRSLGDFETAKTCFRAARDHDAFGYATSRHNEIIRSVATDCNVALVEAETILEGMAADGLIDDSLVWDNCHFKLEPYAHVALVFAKELEAIVKTGKPLTMAPIEEIEKAFGIDAEVKRDVLRGRVRFRILMSILSHDPRHYLDKAMAHLDELAQQVEEDDQHASRTLLLRSIVAGALGDRDEARRMLEKLSGAAPHEIARAEHSTSPVLCEVIRRAGLVDLFREFGAKVDGRPPPSRERWGRISRRFLLPAMFFVVFTPMAAIRRTILGGGIRRSRSGAQWQNPVKTETLTLPPGVGNTKSIKTTSSFLRKRGKWGLAVFVLLVSVFGRFLVPLVMDNLPLIYTLF